MTRSVQEIAAVAIFSAMAFVGGYLFIYVPNVEIFTTIVFLAGVLLGARKGTVVGLISQSLYAILNPFGISPMPLFIAQVLNRMLLGFAGGWLRHYLLQERKLWSRSIVLGATGLFFTMLYDVTTDLSFYLISGLSFDKIRATLALGAPFYLVHIVTNTAIFALILPLIVLRLRGLRVGGGDTLA